MPMVQGRCLCGGVVFEVTAPLGMVMHCHCSICRKFHGSAFATHGVVPADGVRWLAGRELVHRVRSSATNTRPFCSRCGSNVPSDEVSGTVFVPLGNLDDDPGARPLAHIFVGSKAPWYEIPGTLPQFDEYPPGFDTPALPDPPRDPVPAGSIGGSCLCDAIAYRVDGPIGLVRHCHCSRCRRARSAAHATNGFVDPATFRWTRGEELLDVYKVPEAERFTQTFCRTCGSAMPRAFPNRPFVVIPMGSVDGDPGTRPCEHIYVGSKTPWYEIADTLPQHAESPA
jgi:hypothetical protein